VQARVQQCEDLGLGDDAFVLRQLDDRAAQALDRPHAAIARVQHAQNVAETACG
jgi:hypothetical protein